MTLKKKTMRRTEWKGIEERLYADKIVSLPWGRARAGIIYMKRVDEPFYVTSFGKRLQVTGKGYTWLQLAPENEHFWATVMFDETGRLFQYYFDITLANHIDDPVGAWFIDLILDVVMRPGGDFVKLDRSELETMKKARQIDADIYRIAIDSEKQLIDDITGKEAEIRKMCEEIRAELLNEISPEGSEKPNIGHVQPPHNI